MKDLASNIDVKRVISPQSVADNTALVGQIIDKQNYGSLTYLIATGSLADADATFTVLVEEGAAANLSDATAIADIDLVGTEALASFVFSDDNKCFKLGDVGNKRYSRMTITPANNASAALISVVALLGHPKFVPTANPPA